jgi:hypothetical protein
MAAHGPVRRVLLYGIVVGALASAAPSASAFVVTSTALGGMVAPPLYGYGRGGEALLQEVHWGRFCRWYRHHRLCSKLITLRHFCDRRPHHRACDDDDADRFCRRHPHHRKCDKPPSPS